MVYAMLEAKQEDDWWDKIQQMVYKITCSTLALKTYISNIEYLEVIWTEREVKNFIAAVQRKLALLSVQPKTGRLTGK